VAVAVGPHRCGAPQHPPVPPRVCWRQAVRGRTWRIVRGAVPADVVTQGGRCRVGVFRRCSAQGGGASGTEGGHAGPPDGTAPTEQDGSSRSLCHPTAARSPAAETHHQQHRPQPCLGTRFPIPGSPASSFPP